MFRTAAVPLLTLPFVASLAVAAAAGPPTFVVTLDPAVRAEPYTGRVYVFLSRERAEPRTGPEWFDPEPFFARDVTGWKPGEPLTFAPGDPAVLGHPEPLAKLDPRGYAAQAVARLNPLERRVGDGRGNAYGPAVKVGDGATVRLSIDRLVTDRPYAETKWGKLFEVRSKLLSEFHGGEVSLRGTVILPASYYDDPARRYPVIFTIPGFGGDHRIDPVREPVAEANEQGVEFLRVMLDPDSPLGHHVFADSANNGPVGTAFVTEFLPAFDAAFRTISEPSARFLTGHSSGGWSSLWLQVAYPDAFGGVWSTAPDPVDFRDFQRIDLYRKDTEGRAAETMYVDADGKSRPLARNEGRVLLFYRDFAHMEDVLGYGGQLGSFEAVFSPRLPDGRPRPLFDRATGAIDPATAESWKPYDIRLHLERNWPTLGPKLAGKLHVVMGEEDTFYLEGATRLLKASLADLGSDATVDLVPGRDHMDLLTPDLRARIRREMTAAFLRGHPR